MIIDTVNMLINMDMMVNNEMISNLWHCAECSSQPSQSQAVHNTVTPLVSANENSSIRLGKYESHPHQHRVQKAKRCLPNFSTILVTTSRICQSTVLRRTVVESNMQITKYETAFLMTCQQKWAYFDVRICLVCHRQCSTWCCCTDTS